MRGVGLYDDEKTTSELEPLPGGLWSLPFRDRAGDNDRSSREPTKGITISGMSSDGQGVVQLWGPRNEVTELRNGTRTLSSMSS